MANKNLSMFAMFTHKKAKFEQKRENNKDV